MKCKHCDGKGYAYVRTAPNPITGYGYKRVCDYCHGTGEIKQTEQEWLQTCNTEQLAEELLAWWFDGANTYSQFGLFQSEIDEAKEKIMKWLKEKHND